MAAGAPGFNADEVRAGLRFAMTVGLPVETEEQPTFYFQREDTGDGPSDEDAVPFDVSKRRTMAPPRFVRVPCAIEYADNVGKIENFGLLAPTKVKLTLLDEEYVQVKGFQYVVIGGSRYFYSRTETPLGLVTVGVYIIHCVAEDQT